MGGRRSQRLGPSPTVGSLRPLHQRRHKSRVSLWGLPCAHGVPGTPHEEVRNTLRKTAANVKKDLGAKLPDALKSLENDKIGLKFQLKKLDLIDSIN